LNTVCATRRNRVKPASVITYRMAASPANLVSPVPPDPQVARSTGGCAGCIVVHLVLRVSL